MRKEIERAEQEASKYGRDIEELDKETIPQAS